MPRLRLILLFVAAAAAATLILCLGINAPTGLTGKDEYFLGLRIPLEMMQDHRWWVPFIDAAPRLKKPPFIYWTARASYEAFGPSLLSARSVTIAFSLLLLGCTAWLGKQIDNRYRTGLIAAGILLGMSGMASESRRLMLDVPVAALSCAALCCYLHWLRPPPRAMHRRRERSPLVWLVACAIFLSAALMTKGPIAVIVFGAGFATLFCHGEFRQRMLSRFWWHGMLAILALALPAYWYFYVRQHYGIELASAAQDEFEARQLFHVSADPLIGIVTLSLPWGFIALHGLWQRRRERETRMLGLWLFLTLLPFFFIRSFERYLIGSLVPLALLAAIHLDDARDRIPRWVRRLGSLLPALVLLVLGVLLWRLKLGGWGWLVLPWGYFVWTWWRTKADGMDLIASAALLWCIGWGLAFPALGVNAVPKELVTVARDRPVVMFAGPQPALLPILIQRPLRQTSQLAKTDLAPATLLAVRDEDAAAMATQLDALAIRVKPVMDYQSLISAGSGIRFARQGARREDWQRAWDMRSPAPLMSTVHVFEVMP